MGQKWTPEQRKAASDRAKARLQPQTNTAQAPETKATTTDNPSQPAPQLITLTQEQFDALMRRYAQGNTTDQVPAPSMTPGIGIGGGLQTNARGQVVGTVTKFETDPNYYPNPTERLLAEPRLSRFSMSENYFLTWDITSRPYETKDNLSMREPTFHITLYMNQFDDEGNDTGKAIVVQTLHFNEDEQIAEQFAAEHDIDTGTVDMRRLMDKVRYERAKNWLLNVFFPPRTFDLSTQDSEQAIGGQVVKVITKSNVQGFGNKTPRISVEELQ